MEKGAKFGEFVLDPKSQQLRRGGEAVPLTGKAYGVLSFLVERAGELVSKDDLFESVWADTIVSDATLASCIREIRKALGDDARSPRFLETAHRRGYRFIAALEDEPKPAPERDAPLPRASRKSVQWVGRDTERNYLDERMDEARAGQRQIVLVHGEPGIGKTTLVESFVGDLEEGEQVDIGAGQCVETFGMGESYFPVLEALRRLCRGASGDRFVRVLREHAPTWLAQLPGLLPRDLWDDLQREVQGVTRDRMLREIAEAIEILAAERPLVLVIEDLHWGDASTIALLGSLARRPEPARLLVLVTYRPADVAGGEHPLKELVGELSLHAQCHELSIRPLRTSSVDALLEQRFPGSKFPRRLSSVLQERTGGNPLFLVNLIEALIDHGLLEQTDDVWSLSADVEDLPSILPESLRRLMARQRERLDATERAVLDAGAVAGREFCAATVAAALDDDVVAVEARCEALAKRHAFLERAGFAEWADGTRAARFSFQHAFHQEFSFDEVSVSQRTRWHLRMAERLEQAYRGRTAEIACELAVRFEQGAAPERAIAYMRQAGENALQHNGYGEAIDHLRRGVKLLEARPDLPDSKAQQLRFQLLLGHILLMVEDHEAREGEASYRRARDLCLELGDGARLLVALVGLFWFHILRAEYRVAGGLTDEIRDVSARSNDPRSRLWANISAGTIACMRGDFGGAQVQIDEALAIDVGYQPRAGSVAPTGMGAHSLRLFGSETVGIGMAALTAWHLGRFDQAEGTMQAGLATAEHRRHPYGLAMAHGESCHVHAVLGEPGRVRDHAEKSARLCAEHGFRDVETLFPADFYLGWALAQHGTVEAGIAQMRKGLGLQEASGVRMFFVERLAFLAETLLSAGRGDEAREVLNDADVAMAESGESSFEVELHRLRSELLLQQGGSEEQAEVQLRSALARAADRQAHAQGLRVATSLARLLVQREEQASAKAILSDVYAWFSEGFERRDLRIAGELLSDLDS